jgi:hypothetical protein
LTPFGYDSSGDTQLIATVMRHTMEAVMSNFMIDAASRSIDEGREVAPGSLEDKIMVNVTRVE